MTKLIGAIALMFALASFAQAQDSVGDKAHEVKEGAVKAKDVVVEDAKEAGHEVKKVAHKARRAVFTRCADGRHTIRGESGCRSHGGVSIQN